MPEVVAAALALPVRSAVLDGEVIALHPDGRPHPFQVTASRVGSRLEVERLAAALPLTAFLFDLLHLDGQDLIDRPGAERHAALAAVVPEPLRIPRTVTADPAAAAAFLADTLARGHEGVMVKSLAATWEAGRRGAGWLKVKPVHTLDLVVLAAEWGHGRRRGWLSNLHLGARDPAGGFVMLGKTFKGLTDKLLTWQTERLLELAVGPTDGYVVHVRPELVVEIAFDGLQTSPRYPGGLALRFARVLRYRPDKRPEEADTIQTVRPSTHASLTTGTRDISCISRNAIYRGGGRHGQLDARGTRQAHLRPLDRVVVELSRGRSASSATTGPPSRCRSWTGGRCGSARRTGR